MTRRRAVLTALVVIVTSFAGARANAGLLSEPSQAGFAPRVPLSAFALPASWFDPSRLHLMSTVSMGSGFGGKASALQVTNLSYQFRAPITMSVRVGNTFGLDKARRGSNPFFLEGFDLSWRPNKNSLLRIEMHDVRSPLQYGYSPYGRGWNSDDPFSAAY